MTSADPSNLTPVKKRAYNAKRPCSAHSSRTGEPCRKPAIAGGTVCRTHGGAASVAKAKARKRIEEAADRLARQLLGIAEGAESEAVRLAAVKDALDRAGIQAKTAATVTVSVKPWETVMEGISKVVAGPRDPQQQQCELPAAGESDESDESDAEMIEAEVIGPDDPDPSRGLEAIEPGILEGYSDSDPTTNAEHPSGVTTPERGVSSLCVDAGPAYDTQLSALGGPLGPRGPVGNGLMSLQDATAAVAQMKAEHAARLRAEADQRREDYQSERDAARAQLRRR